jgi:eukaryotic translation initiation factor 2C
MPPRPPRGTGPRGGPPARGRGVPPPGRGGGGGTARGGGAAAPAQGAGRGGQIALAEHIETIGERKRGYGREGRPFEVFTNHFAMEISDNIISHYDGQLFPTRFHFLISRVLSCNVACFCDPPTLLTLSRYA